MVTSSNSLMRLRMRSLCPPRFTRMSALTSNTSPSLVLLLFISNVLTSMSSSLRRFSTSDTVFFDEATNPNCTAALPNWGIKVCNDSRPTSTRVVVIAATTYRPVPQARPMAAVTHRPANGNVYELVLREAV